MIANERLSLHEETVRLIKNRPRDLLLRDIERETKVPIHFIEHLVAGKQAGPNVNRVQALYEFLSGRKLI